MKKLNLFLMLALFGLGMMVQTVEAQISHAPATAEFGLQATTGPAANARLAIAPYAQVTANATYTFIGISHPSLDTAHTSIGIAVEALDMVTVPNTVAGRANGQSEGFRDATMLSYWGSVVVEAQTTGFAMEFIGDMNDSAGGSSEMTCQSVDQWGADPDPVMQCISSGLNIQ